MSQLAADLRLAVRALARRPGLTAVAVAVLALGIGANTAIFSAIDLVLLSPPPVEDPERLVVLWAEADGRTSPVSLPDLLEWRREAESFAGVAALRGHGFTLGGDGGPAERIGGAMASADLFALLGLEAGRGRLFAPAAGEAPGERLPRMAGDGDDVAVLGHDLWQRRFGADPGIVGTTIRLDREPYTVIGVLAEDDLRLPWMGEVDVWVPFTRFEDAFLSRGTRSNTQGIARLAPGVPLAAARAEVAAIAARQARDYPENNVGLGVALVPLHEALVDDARPILWIVQGVVLAVLAIACVNLANLLLVRTHARRQELAVRRAMGAGRGRLVRQLLAESLVLGLAGGVAGVLVGLWGIEGLKAMGGEDSSLQSLTLDGGVLAVAAGLSVVSGLLAGLLPALAAGRTADPLAGGARTGGGTGGRRLRQGLVTLQLAMALVLLVGAGLMLRSLDRVLAIDLGFDTAEALTAEIALPEASYDRPRTIDFFTRLGERLAQRPEVAHAALADPLPLSGSTNSTSIEIEGQAPPADGRAHQARYVIVDPGYFAAMGIERLAGRGFRAADGPQAAPVTIVDRRFAERHWPGGSAVGRRVRWGGDWAQVVGVVEPVPYVRPDEEPRPVYYRPLAQAAPRRMDVVVRGGDPDAAAAALAEELAALDPEIPVHRLRSLPEVTLGSIEQHRYPAILLGLFAAVALLLAALGTYGVMAYSVVRRTREIGVRMALGAGRRQVLGTVMGEGMGLVALGVVAGLAGGWVLGRVLSGFLYQVSPADPASFVAVTAVLAATAGLACWLPARRAARVDPLTALRWE